VEDRIKVAVEEGDWASAAALAAELAAARREGAD
jgi:hypothetical protein